MSQEDSSPVRTGVRRVSSSSGKGSADRRPLQFWKTFNTWWRQDLEQTGRRPGSDDITRWYELQADAVWGPEKPSLHETRIHAKCLRTVSSVREYFREYRKKKHDHTGSEDDDEDIVCRRGSTPGTAADGAESEIALFSYSRRPSRDSGTPAGSPGTGMTGAAWNLPDVQDSGHWQPASYSSSSAGQSSRGGRTGRGRGTGRARQKAYSMEPVSYEIHPGALGPDMMSAAHQPATATTTPTAAVARSAPLQTAASDAQLLQPPMQLNMELSGGCGASGVHPSLLHPQALKFEAVGQAPYCSPRGVAAAAFHSHGFAPAPAVVPGGVFSSSGAETSAAMPAIKQDPAELAYSMPWVQEQKLQQQRAAQQQQHQQQQYQQLHMPASLAGGMLPQHATAQLANSQAAAGQPASNPAGAFANAQGQTQGFAAGPVAATLPHMCSAASAAGGRFETGLVPMPHDFLAQFAGQTNQCQQQQPPICPYTVQHQQQVLMHPQQHQQHSASQPMLPSVLPAGPRQQQLQQHMQPPPLLELQRQPIVQHDLHQLHQQFIQEAKPTPRGFHAPLLFSDNTNLGCDDIIPPPPLFSGGVGAGLPQLGLTAVGGDLMQQQRGMAAAVAGAAAGPSVGHNAAGILSELEAIKGPAMAGLVDAHCANQQQRISVSALLDVGPFGPAARRLSQGLDLHSGLSLPHQRLSLCAMGSDFLGDLLGDFAGLGDLDAFLGTTTTTTAGTAGCSEPLILPRISEGGCGAMAPPSATGRASLRWNILGDHWHGGNMAAPTYNHLVAAASTAGPCQAGTGSVNQQAGPQSSMHVSAPAGLHLDLTSPRRKNGGLMSPPGFEYAAHAAGSAAGHKRAWCSTGKMPAGPVLDVNCVKRPRVSGLLMDMDTPKVRAMAVGAGITALTPKSPAVTPNRIAALAVALANAAAAARQSHDAAIGKDKQAPKDRELKKLLPSSHKFVLNLSDSPVTLEAAEQQQQALPAPAFQTLYSGKACSTSAAAAEVASEPLLSAHIQWDCSYLEPTAAAPAAAAAPSAAPAAAKKVVVLNLCDEPVPAAFGNASPQTVSVLKPAQEALVAPTASSGPLGEIAKSTKGFLPALHEIESMIWTA